MTTPVQPTNDLPLPNYTLPQWHSVLAKAEQAVQNNPNDIEAREWVHIARGKVAEVGQQEYRPTSALEDLSSVGKGAVEGIKGIPAGLLNIVSQLGHGDVGGAISSVGQGFESMGKGMVAPFQLAGRELSGEDVPASERQAALEQGGQSLAGLGAMDVAAPIKANMEMGPITGIARGGLGGALKSIARSLPGAGLVESIADRPGLKTQLTRMQVENAALRNKILQGQLERGETAGARSDLALRTSLSRLREEVAPTGTEGPPPPQGFEPTSPPSGPFGGQPQGGTVAPKGTISDIPGTAGKGLQVTGEAPPMGAAAPKPTLADMTGMSNLQYEPGEITQAQTPVQQLMESLNIEQSPEVGDLTWKRPRGIQPSFPDIGKFRKGQAPEEPTALPEQGLAEALNPESEMAQNAMTNLLKKLGSARRGL